ncbi:MAG: putative sugar O-methyltransferase, partial [Nitrospirota bacterium]
RHVDPSNIRSVAEIGAGYGRLAHMAVSRFPHWRYCIFDIPPAVVISQHYLAALLGEPAVRPVPAGEEAGADGDDAPRVRVFLPHQLEQFPDGYFDLVINISSFDEMSREQVENYFSLIDRKCSGWFYIKGHDVAPPWCQTSAGGLTELPYKASWTLVHQRKDPFSPSFIERIYRTPGGRAG